MAKKKRTTAPDSLSVPDLRILFGWCHQKFPWWERDLQELVEACLEHHGAKGTLMACWRRTCMTWVRRHDQYHPDRRAAWERREQVAASIREREARWKAEEAEHKAPTKAEQLAFDIQPSVRPMKGPLGEPLREALLWLGRQRLESERE